MPIDDPQTFIWPSYGIEPPNEEDALYAVGEQPIAGFDNNIMRRVSEDIHYLFDWSATHGSIHEAGGAQEIDLDGLSVGTVATLVALDTDNELRIEGSAGNAAISVDLGDDLIGDFPDFDTQTTHRKGLQTGYDIERTTGETIYDYNADRFHRAETADKATWADDAGDSEHLRGHVPDDFLQPDQTAEITAPWEFGPTVDADISGNAQTANWADEAEWATDAGWADGAADSELLEGHTVEDILSKVDGDLLEGIVPEVQDDGQTVVDEASTFSFDQSIDVEADGDTAHMSVDSVPHSQETNYAFDSNKVDGYHAQEIINLAASKGGDEGRWVHIDDFQLGGENQSINWDLDIENEYGDIWDIYKMVLVHENCETGGSSGTGIFKKIKININYDFRFRYKSKTQVSASAQTSSTSANVSIGASGGSFISISSTTQVSTGNNNWGVAPCKENQRAIAEYKIAAPRPMTSSVENKPHIAVQQYNGDPEADDVLEAGELGTNFDDIHAFSLSSDHDAAAYVQLWGTDLNTV